LSISLSVLRRATLYGGGVHMDGCMVIQTYIQGNLGLTNLKGPTILFFIAGILIFMGLFTIELTTEGLEIKFFIAGILLLKGSLY
jgi:hypothetical protein